MQGCNFGLKSGGIKLKLPKALRIEMYTKGIERGEEWGWRHPSPTNWGSGAVVELYHNL